MDQDQINQKLDALKEDLMEIKSVQKDQAKDLQYHIKRTDLLEEKVETLKTEVLPLLPEIKKVLKWWPLLSAVVLVMVSGKQEIFNLVMKYLGGN